MATITSSGGISNAGSGSTTQSGTGATSNSNNIKDTTDGSEKQFEKGYSGPAVVAADGSLIATPGAEVTQVGSEVNAGPGQITGAATIGETKDAVAEVGGNPSKVGELVADPSADSEGEVLDLKSEISGTIEETITEKTIANTVGSITQNRPSPLGDANEPDTDSGMAGVTETVVGDGDGGNDYSITGTVEEDVSNADNTGPQTVPGVPVNAGDGAGASSVFDIVGVGGIVALIGVVGYLMTQQ